MASEMDSEFDDAVGLPLFEENKIRPDVSLECNLLGIGDSTVPARVKEIRPDELRVSSSHSIPKEGKVVVEFNSARYHMSETVEGVIVKARSNPTVGKYYAKIHYADADRGRAIFEKVEAFMRRHLVAEAKEKIAEAEEWAALGKWGKALRTARIARKLDPKEASILRLELKALEELRQQRTKLAIAASVILAAALAIIVSVLLVKRRNATHYAQAIQQAKQARDTGDHVLAHQKLDEALGLRPGDSEAGALRQELVPKAYAEHFAVPSQYEDSYGNPVRKARDYVHNYPLEMQHKASGIYFSFVPPGQFQMGSPKDEEGRGKDEQQHSVAISRPFYMSKYEITVGDFRKFVEKTGHKTEASQKTGGHIRTEAGYVESPEARWTSPGFPQDASHPVVLVSWNDAQAFVSYLEVRSKGFFRLPTEAEWEYACRAKSTGTHFWGNQIKFAGNYANLADSSSLEVFPFWPSLGNSDSTVYTMAEGKPVPNDFGIRHSTGNVWEWCQDWYNEDYYSSSPLTDPTGPASGKARVVRGGSWSSLPLEARSASRLAQEPSYRSNDLGFRVVAIASESRP